MRIALTLLALIVLIAALGYSTESGQSGRSQQRPRAASTGRSRTAEPPYVPSEVLVQLRRDASSDAKTRIRDMFDIQVKSISVGDEHLGELLLVSLPPGKTVEAAIAEIRDIPGVAFAQRNWIYTIQQLTPNDPEYTSGRLWGMYSDDLPIPVGPKGTKNSYGSQAEEAWAKGLRGSRDVYVGVLDEGVQILHRDLAGNIWTNAGETGVDSSGRDKRTNGVDDDGNGLSDDVHGWDFYHGDNCVYDGGFLGTADEHGTHLAGTIGGVGGVGNNEEGVVGVNWYVTMIPAKFIGPANGKTDKVVAAIDYLVRLKNDGLNIVAINASWGGDAYDLCLLEAIKRAARKNILFIAGAGNGDFSGKGFDSDEKPFYPACYSTLTNTESERGTPGAWYDSVISVAAITRDGRKAGFSNYGLTTVDLGAPGTGIKSTWPYATYKPRDGTSMATAHVTGAAALYASKHPDATAEAIKSAILDAAKCTPTPSLATRTVTGGRLNVSRF